MRVFNQEQIGLIHNYVDIDEDSKIIQVKEKYVPEPILFSTEQFEFEENTFLISVFLDGFKLSNTQNKVGKNSLFSFFFVIKKS